ncbi:hypothetical protein KH5_24590 [Urechidicola sp. KH5]
MRWEEAAEVALCYWWIEFTVKRLDDEHRKQYFTPRKPKSVWSKVNKNYIKELDVNGLLHESGLQSIVIAKENCSWTAVEHLENGVIPIELLEAFDANLIAYENYMNFAPSY